MDLELIQPPEIRMERQLHDNNAAPVDAASLTRPLPDQIEGRLMGLLEVLKRENNAIVLGRLSELEECLAEKQAILDGVSALAASLGKGAGGTAHQSDDGFPQENNCLPAGDSRVQMRLSELKKKILLANQRNRVLLEDCSRISGQLYGLLLAALSKGTVYDPNGRVDLSPPTGRLLSGKF